jgi:hypothetical protein
MLQLCTIKNQKIMSKLKWVGVTSVMLMLAGTGVASAHGSQLLTLDAQCTVQAGSSQAICNVTKITVGVIGLLKIETATGLINAQDLNSSGRPNDGSEMYMTSGADEGETVVWGT